MALDDFDIGFTCDCGHEFPVSVGRFRSGDEFACPACGRAERADEESIRAFDDQLASLTGAALDKAGELLGDKLAKAARGVKNLDYTRKR